MVYKWLAAVIVFVGATTVRADEPKWLAQAGLGGLQVGDDSLGGEIRGTLGVRSTSLAQVSGIIYDYRSGSRFNVDSVNYGAAIGGPGDMYDRSGAETAVIAGVSGFEVNITNTDGTTFGATLNALSYGAGKGIIMPQITPGPYPD